VPFVVRGSKAPDRVAMMFLVDNGTIVENCLIKFDAGKFVVGVSGALCSFDCPMDVVFRFFPLHINRYLWPVVRYECVELCISSTLTLLDCAVEHTQYFEIHQKYQIAVRVKHFRRQSATD
jgi:hypothetical protein